MFTKSTETIMKDKYVTKLRVTVRVNYAWLRYESILFFKLIT